MHNLLIIIPSLLLDARVCSHPWRPLKGLCMCLRVSVSRVCVNAYDCVHVCMVCVLVYVCAGMCMHPTS